ncbi:hypothetical protein ES702_06185 [subsurface metagenome]
MEISNLITLLLLGGSGNFSFDGLLSRLQSELGDEVALNKDGLESALEDLIETGFVVATTDGYYEITAKGREFLWSSRLFPFIKKFHRSSYYDNGELREEVA